MQKSLISVTDNGCGMTVAQFKTFLAPNLSFKDGKRFRGSKGVGATYLAYGFNHLEVATKFNHKVYSGILRGGRNWVEDTTETIVRPMVENGEVEHTIFQSLDRGTSFTIRLSGNNIRPKDLSWVGATTAGQWLALLRLVSPIGGIYMCKEVAPDIQINIDVVNKDGALTQTSIGSPNYLYPHEVISQTVDLREFLAWQRQRVNAGKDPSQLPPKYLKLNGLWGEWTGEQILKRESPITSPLDDSEQELVLDLKVNLYIFMAFSTDLWDHLNDNQLLLRKGARHLRGGLQLATRNMPQGQLITIPMTNNIGFQNLAHVIVHFENAEPDLGRKGFQPEVERIAEKLSVSAVTALRQRYNLLRKPGAASVFGDEVEIDKWIKEHEQHELKYPLVISGKGLFRPLYELPIRSEPIVEQDVVALFNQMLSSGIIRGIQLISSSQYKQYDGLYRVHMKSPWDDYILSSDNPLGINQEHFAGASELRTPIKVLEFKQSLNGLIEEFQTDEKSPEHVSLVIAWEMGEKWKEIFDITSYLDESNTHHRQIHGTTHSFTYSMTGQHAFEAIILKDLIHYLQDPQAESRRQQQNYSTF